MEFHIGDKVRVGSHVGAITDVGTLLIQVQTTEGGLRVACPWELVKTRDGDRARLRWRTDADRNQPAEQK
jgi:hypothetical protein